MAEYYVSPFGSDSNSGSIGSPFLTITFGLAHLAAGDTLFIRGGTYVENISVPASANGSSAGASGSSWPNATTVSAYLSETVWVRPSSGVSAVVFPTGGTPRSYQIWSGINVDGANLNGAADPVVYIGHDAHHIRWQNSENKNAYWSGIAAFQGPYIEIKNNHIHHGDRHGVGAAGHGIYISGFTGNTTGADQHGLIEGNECDHFSAQTNDSGIQLFTGATDTNSLGGFVIRNNWLHDNGVGTFLGEATTVPIQFYSNVVVANIGSGVVLFSRLVGSLVYGNAIYSNGDRGLEVGTGGVVTGASIKHNAIASNIGAPITVWNTDITSFAIIQFNDFYSNGGSNVVNDQNGLSTISNNITTSPGLPPISGQIFLAWIGPVADPRLVSTTVTMPAGPVTATATYISAPTFTLTVTLGTGDGSYAAGTVVPIDADAPASGHVFVGWTGATVASAMSPSTTLVMPAAPTTVVATYAVVPSGALVSSDLTYLGAFRLPNFSNNGTFSFGGAPIAFNPVSGNTLFVANGTGQVAEVTIPTPVNSGSIGALNFAAYVQPFADPTEGHLQDVANGANPASLSGMMVAGGLLYLTATVYYDADPPTQQTVSHARRPLTLASVGGFSGWKAIWSPTSQDIAAGVPLPGTGYASGDVAPVPPEWQSSLGGDVISSQWGRPIITRESYGPDAIVWNRSTFGLVDGRRVQYYTSPHPTLGPWDGANTVWGGTAIAGGLVLIDGTSSALFFGRNGLGSFCYGDGTATNPPPTGECYDPTSTDKGQHAYPYVYQVWAYNINDWVAVKNGSKQPWEVVPYATWVLTFPIVDPSWKGLGGAGYDPVAKRLYVSQLRVDVDGFQYRPLIHAFQLP